MAVQHKEKEKKKKQKKRERKETREERKKTKNPHRDFLCFLLLFRAADCDIFSLLHLRKKKKQLIPTIFFF